MANTRAKARDKGTQLSNTMNKQVANFSVLYMKLHHYHWYVKGENFFTLHVKFEELYNEAALHVDTIAERMLALGAAPASTLEETLKLSSLEEALGDESANDMVQTLVDDVNTICRELSEGITMAEEHEDEPTADLFTEIRASLEKHGWMLRAYLAS
ncbi:Dps family protein [Neobacillus citreus]|uniref:DNA starvation/stationary phase protection protein n=1 Tax=Neobacillus citreus TaxID=2833578 RepID=A0A942TB11_9BACI|nr:DNA starvation/stationary phase protection protein [Neobacillus citreus]MCH6267448.1 DNA starvation/stationary phase protection protein [Neobacillus citreus]